MKSKAVEKTSEARMAWGEEDSISMTNLPDRMTN